MEVSADRGYLAAVLAGAGENALTKGISAKADVPLGTSRLVTSWSGSLRTEEEVLEGDP